MTGLSWRDGLREQRGGFFWFAGGEKGEVLDVGGTICSWVDGGVEGVERCVYSGTAGCFLWVCFGLSLSFSLLQTLLRCLVEGFDSFSMLMQYS